MNIRNRRVILLLSVFALGLLVAGLIGAIALHRYTSPAFQLKKAEKCVEKNAYEDAVFHYERAILLSENASGIRLALAELYRKNENYVGYLLQLSEVIASPVSSENHVEKAYNKLIDYYDSQGNYQAINYLLNVCTNTEVLNANQKYLAKPPEFSSQEGTYGELIPLKLSSNAAGTIYYTIDGSVPNENSSVYTNAIMLETGEYRISAFFMNEYGIKSDVVTKKYYIAISKPDAPVVEPESGQYTAPGIIAVQVPESHQVYYTSDGTIPDENSSLYTSPIHMPLGKSEYRFVAYNQEGVASNVTNRQYELEIVTEYTTDECCMRVAKLMKETGKIIDTAGNNKETSGKYKYVFSYAVTIPEQGDFYIINEIYEDSAGVRTGTGSSFAVGIYSGEVYRLTIENKDTYILKEIDTK